MLTTSNASSSIRRPPVSGSRAAGKTLASGARSFFSEVRYHLAIAVFMFPFAGLAACWLAESVRGARAFRRHLAENGVKASAGVKVLRDAIALVDDPMPVFIAA